MREIKFRFFDTTSKRMYGMKDIQEYSLERLHRFSSTDDPYTKVMQYTGLTDKNGVEIYEGDVIHAFGAPLEVKWIVDGWFADCELTGVCEAGQEWDDNCEVIGNIYENTELLK